MSLRPGLSISQWMTFGLLAAVLSLVNIYTTLLTGWGTGGSILAVLSSVLILRTLSAHVPSLEVLNLGQTIASAGGTVGIAAAAYAAVRMVEPAFEPGIASLVALFAGLVVLAVVLGAAVRRHMVRLDFPTGTACAVIQRTVRGEGEEARRPVRLLARAGAVAAVLTVPTKLALSRGGPAIVGALPLGRVGGVPVGLGTDPLFYGIGLIVGPKIGGGLLLGGLLSAFVVSPTLAGRGVAPASMGSWMAWVAVAAVAAPTFASLLVARWFRTPPRAAAGMEPRDVQAGNPLRALGWVAALGAAGACGAAIVAFEMPWWVAIGGLALCLPLSVIKARVAADTDVNPVLLSVIVLMTLCAWTTSAPPVVLTGLAIIVSLVAGVSVDLLQDYRTGYLLGVDAGRQTSAQLVGALIGVAVSVPFVLVLDASVGFGEAGLPAPGPRIYAAVAGGLSGDAGVGEGLAGVFAVVSLIGCVLAFAGAFPPTRNFTPSVFGIGIGLLLPLDMSLAIALGALARAVVTRVWPRRADDVSLVGSAIFAASAVVGVLVVLATIAMDRAGLTWFFLAPMG